MDIVYLNIDGTIKMYVERQPDGKWAVCIEGFNGKDILGNKTYDLKTSAEMAMVLFCEEKGLVYLTEIRE